MKNLKKGFIGLFVLAIAVIFVTGCEPKREALKFDGEEGSLVFNVKADGGYKISTKEKRKDNDDFKEVEYSGIKGIQYFYGGYNSYTIYLPIEGDKDHVLVLSVYGKEDKEKAAKEAITNEEVLDVLNHITDIKGKK